jgi:hypothetical protein
MARGDITGLLAGIALAPVTGLLSAARRSRMFHPSGLVCSAHAEPLPGDGRARDVAERLAGPVLLRWSSAWWKTGEWIDVLGCALRFSHGPLDSEPKPGDQDLLLATIQRPWTMPFAPWTTRDHDYLANAYFGVSPFEVAPLGRIEWRLTARSPAPGTGSRQQRLEAAISAASAVLFLEWSPYPGPLRKPVSARFEPLLRIQLTGFVDLDQRSLRFDPFRNGRGIQPVGFVHAMRRAAYWTSQRARPSADGASDR